MANETLQFPLALLAYGNSREARLEAIISYAYIKTGMDRMEKLSPTQAAQELIGYTPPRPSKDITEVEIMAIMLGCKFCALNPPTTTHQAKCRLEKFRSVQQWLDQWQAAGRTTAWTRVPTTMTFEARDGNEWTYKRFTSLCAVNAAIGSKQIATVTRNRVRAGMLGYTGGGMLFDKAGQLTESGRALLAERLDGARPVTTSQARTWLDNLVRTGLLHRFSPPPRGSLTYFSKILPAELIGQELIRRAKRTSATPRLKQLGEELERIKAGEAPLCGEGSEKPPHNGQSPRNGEITTPSPPGRHPVATQSLHNASGYASENASLKASSYAGGERDKAEQALNGQPEGKREHEPYKPGCPDLSTWGLQRRK